MIDPHKGLNAMGVYAFGDVDVELGKMLLIGKIENEEPLTKWGVFVDDGDGLVNFTRPYRSGGAQLENRCDGSCLGMESQNSTPSAFDESVAESFRQGDISWQALLDFVF